MIGLSKKCQYALRSVLELAARYGQRPVSVSEMASVQAIPRRFLELIIRDLKQAGIVVAYRGVRGGYTLARDPRDISVGEIIQLIDGDLNLVDCEECGGEECCPLSGNCAWTDLWHNIQKTVKGICTATTFQGLLEAHNAPAAISGRPTTR